MQNFDDLEKKMLDEHGLEYKVFSRLILTLTVACITILASSVKVQFNILYGITFGLLALSILLGVIVQYRIMMRPLWFIQGVSDENEEAIQNGEKYVVKLRRPPSKMEQWGFNFQCLFFVTSFLSLTLQYVST